MTSMTGMNDPARISAAIAYIPVLGWLYVFFLQRKNSLAIYHLRQSIGLILFMIAVLAVWAVIAWLLAWIPFMAVLSAALFALVIAAYLYAVLIWVTGLLRALRSQSIPLPVFGHWADRLPIR